MIDKVKTDDCYLCYSCQNVCPKNCISFSKRHLTFDYPEVDYSSCINCGLCEKVCPALNEDKLKYKQPLLTFIAKNNDDEQRKRSSSGGMFLPFAKEIIALDGIVVGAAYDDNFNVIHKTVDNENDLFDLCGSKYASSDTRDIYKEVKKLLKSGSKVLFTGCPCQVGTLKMFLGKEFENLYTIDLICHAAPSNNLLQEYLKYLETKHKSKILTLNFRDKNYPWIESNFTIVFENGNIISQPMIYDMYMRGYFGNITTKKKCADCKFKNFGSGSDITIGDFWGAEVEYKDMLDNLGVSTLIINTDKGKKLFDNLRNRLNFKETSLDIISKYNSGLIKSFKLSDKRDEFFAYAERCGNIKALKKYCSERKTDKFFRLAKKKLKQFI